ncbi:hypothetical protein [Aeromonas salmonicida]
MNTIKVVGIDIAKSVFQVCVWMAEALLIKSKVGYSLPNPPGGLS